MTESEACYKPDTAFIRNVLRRYENDPRLEVKSVNMSPGCDKGDNFMSVVNRLTITGTTGNGQPYYKSFISKNRAQNEYHQEIFQSESLFANEAAMYQALPVLLGKKRRVFPNCLYADTERIVLDDLKMEGFLLGNRIECLDFDHTKLVLETLADFHASSLILEHTEPRRFLKLRKNIVEMLFPDTDPPGIGKFVNDYPNFIVLCLKTAATSEDDNSKQIAFMEEHRGKVYNVLKELVKPAEYSVLCHGDFWMNNLLFKYKKVDENKVVIGVRFLDFQVARFAPLVTDILYLLHTSVRHELLVENFNTFLEIYYKRLRSNLLILPANVRENITLEWLKKEVEKYRLYGLFVSLWLAPAVMMDAKDAPDDVTLAAQTAENSLAVDYWKERLSPRLLQRIVQKCKYFIK